MKNPNTHIDTFLSKLLILTFLLGFFLLFTETRIEDKQDRQYAKIVSVEINHICQAEVVPDTKIPAYHPNLASAEEFRLNYQRKTTQLQLITENLISVYHKDMLRKYTSFKHDIFIGSFIQNRQPDKGLDPFHIS